MWIRLLGKGETQKRAIEQICSFPVEDPLRSVALQLLVTWKVSLELTQFAAQEDEETMVLLSQVYVEWEERTEKREARSLILRQLNRRVGESSIAILSQIDLLSLSELENLGEALLDFLTLEDLTTWLGNHKSL